MPRLYLSLDTHEVSTSRADSGHIGDDTPGSPRGIHGFFGGTIRQEIGFTRAGQPNTLDLGADPEIQWLLKNDEGDTKFDDPLLLSAESWTQFTETNPANGGTDYFYFATLSLAGAVCKKLLGVDMVEASEVFTVTAVADSAGSLAGKYFDIYTSTTAYDRVWMSVSGTGSAPAAGTGGTLRQLSFSTGATAATIATALAALYSGDANFTASAVTATVTFTRIARATLGWHHPRSSGFAIALTTAGAGTGVVTDVDEVPLRSEISYLHGDYLQISRPFRLTLRNTVRR